MIFGNPLNAIGAIKIIVNDLLCKREKRIQYRFPKSKKKRIRKKWSRRQENYKYVPDDIMFEVGGILYVSRRIFKELEAGIKNNKHPFYAEPEWLKTLKFLSWFELEMNKTLNTL